MTHGGPDPRGTRVFTAFGRREVGNGDPNNKPAEGMKELIERLRFVRPEVATKLTMWRDIDDVLDKDIKRRRFQTSITRLRQGLPEVVDGEEVRGIFETTTPVSEFHHLPRGNIEPVSEYNKRVRLTPFFPETPGIVATRRGAMFANEPTIDVPEVLEPFLKHIGPLRQAYDQVLDFLAIRAYSYGFLAVLIDFRQLPEDVRERMLDGENISVEEVERRDLNQPVLGIFNDRQVIDFQYDLDDGRLSFVKLLDIFNDRELWSDAGNIVERYRIVTRTNIEVWEVRKRGKDEFAEMLGSIAHGARDEDGNPEVPVVIINPNGHQDQIGDPDIWLSVQADLASVRLLSDAMYNLYLHGNPQLVLSTPLSVEQAEERAEDLGLGAGRYVTTLAANPAIGRDGEETLSYLQLDTAGLQMLLDTQKEFSNKANELASRVAPNSTTQPVPMSGAAKAWDYKTSEEKALCDHVSKTEFFSDNILKMLLRGLVNRGVIAGDLNALSAEIRTSFQPSFDIADPEFNTKVHDTLIEISMQLNLPGHAEAAIRRLSGSFKNMSATEKEEFETDIKNWRKRFEADKALAAETAKSLPPPGQGVLEDTTDGNNNQSSEDDDTEPPEGGEDA